jgi:methionyl aminopeptidase
MQAKPRSARCITKDRKLSAQWEHTILITEAGYEMLTISQWTQAKPALLK